MAHAGTLTFYIHRSGHRIHRASPWRVVGHLPPISTGQAIASIEPVDGVWCDSFLQSPHVRPSHPSSPTMPYGPLTAYIHRSGHRIHRASPWRVVGHLPPI